MDFAYSEDQQAIGDLARQILSDKASPERVSEIEKSGGKAAPKIESTKTKGEAEKQAA